MSSDWKVLINIQMSDIKVTSESRVKLLVIYIDNRLNFDYRVSQLCKKASKELHALARIFNPLVPGGNKKVTLT